MADISTTVRAYYDTVAEPVTAEEILSAARRPARARRRENGLPNWAIAAAFAVALVAVIGGVSLLLGGSVDPGVPAAPEDSTDQSSELAPPGVWMGDGWGVLLYVDPPVLPPVVGIYDVTVRGIRTGEQNGVWVLPCPRAHGDVDPSAWDTHDGSIASICGLNDDAELETGDFIDGAFEITMPIAVDPSTIWDGGIVISVGHIWVPIAGNVLVRVSDNAESRQDETFDTVDVPGLAAMITYWNPFVTEFNSTYRNLDGCDVARALASDARDAYRSTFAQWDDTVRPTPGYEYDRAVARFLASERWLHDNTCPGRDDFTATG